MSTYQKQTKHPVSKKWEDAMWIDDYFGSHNYGVQFPSNNVQIFDVRIFELETRDTQPRLKKFTTKDSGKRVKFDSGFQRDTNEGKARFDLIPTELLTRLAELYARGAVKYDDNNWKKAVTPEEISRFKESAWRHFVQWSSGEEDEDHAMGAIWNIISYEWHMKHKNNE